MDMQERAFFQELSKGVQTRRKLYQYIQLSKEEIFYAKLETLRAPTL